MNGISFLLRHLPASLKINSRVGKGMFKVGNEGAIITIGIALMPMTIFQYFILYQATQLVLPDYRLFPLDKL